MDKNEEWINKLLEPSGIKINGENPWDIKILNQRVYDRIKAEGSLGLGESYMEGWWDCNNLDQFFYKLFLAKIPEKVGFSIPLVLGVIATKIFNLQKKSRAFQIAERHYDLDNKLFSAMLGKTMAYSCGYWKKAKDLDSAQFAKYDLICRKLGLKKARPSTGSGQGGEMSGGSIWSVVWETLRYALIAALIIILTGISYNSVIISLYNIKFNLIFSTVIAKNGISVKTKCP